MMPTNKTWSGCKHLGCSKRYIWRDAWASGNWDEVSHLFVCQRPLQHGKPWQQCKLSGDSLHSQPLTSTHSTLPHIIDNSTLFSVTLRDSSVTLRDIPHRRWPHNPSPECFRISNSEPIYVPALISPYLRLGLVDILRDTSELDLEKYPMPVVIILFGTIVWLLLLLL